ncbi:hypothetical protein AK812_SmicGene40878 [Symbiodinium microadriaticum]|uniref:Uncharacterized protein n=1 Tax=Symbiodinium microadriaticum TaxID=2951 RepID=A0A1Q9C7P9_SYMMI|nr:hypothetical protein AK812_SmicGene40878 [Symbiodinium microadriaticum]
MLNDASDELSEFGTEGTLPFLRGELLDGTHHPAAAAVWRIPSHELRLCYRARQRLPYAQKGGVMAED